MCVKIGEKVTSQRRGRMMCARDISSDETGSRSAIRVWVNPGRGPRRLIHATRGVRGRDRGLNARVGVHRGVNSRSRFVHTVPSTLGARVDPDLIERLYRDVRAYAIPGGSEEIMLDLGVRQAMKQWQVAQSRL